MEWEQEKHRRQSVHHIKEQLDACKLELDQQLRNGNFSRAGELQYDTIPKLEMELVDASKKPSSKSSKSSQKSSPSDAIKGDEEGEGEGDSATMVRDTVTEDDITLVVARHTGIPVKKLRMGERARLMTMEDNLEQRVVGQRNAVDVVSNAVRVVRAGLHAHKKPLGCFLFLGPSGVGKTELTKALAEFLFDDEQAMVRIDMSEYMERHSLSRLIGAPPGYVGYEEGGTLTEAVRRRPYQIVLLDEIEKAHREVTNILLQVFDEGHLTDSQGRRVDFRNTIIIMTSNLGSHLSESMFADVDANANDTSTSTALTTQKATEHIMTEAMRAHFSPEFINRIDEVVMFRRLTWEDMKPIAQLEIAKIQRLLSSQERRLSFSVEDAACHWIIERGYDPMYGARPLRRALQTHVLNPLSKQILQGDIIDGSSIELQLHNDKLVFAVTPPVVDIRPSS